MAAHSVTGIISLISSSISYLLALYIYVLSFSNELENALSVSLVLAIVAFITGLIARFGSQKDNFGIPGILAIFVVPLLLVVSL